MTQMLGSILSCLPSDAILKVFSLTLMHHQILNWVYFCIITNMLCLPPHCVHFSFYLIPDFFLSLYSMPIEKMSICIQCL